MLSIVFASAAKQSIHLRRNSEQTIAAATATFNDSVDLASGG